MSSSLRLPLLAGSVTISLLLCAVAAPGGTRLIPQIDPHDIAGALVDLGSRETGSQANAEAAKILAAEMAYGRGTEVQIPTSRQATSTFSGITPGETDSEVVLSAHFDTIAGSPGALDNASGCAVVLASYRNLAPVPRHRALRALFFDAEEQSLAGSAEWFANLSEIRRTSIFASLSAEMVGLATASTGVIRPATADRQGRWTLTPIWLIHLALEGAKAVRFPVVVADARWPIFAQLGLRVARPTRISDSRSFLEVGIPALTLSDISLTESEPTRHSRADGLDRLDAQRLERWTSTLAAIVLQIDSLRDQPLNDTEYLVAGNRVWIRRDLLWVGLILWAPMVFRGLPGKWRGASAESKRRRGRKYLPGFAFRMLFLVSLVLVPTLSSVLLYPAAILAWIPEPRSRAMRHLIGSLAFLPLLGFASWLAMAQMAGHLALHSGAIWPLALVFSTLASYWFWRVDQRPFQSA